MHSTKWGHRAPHEAGSRTGLRAQLSRGAHLTWTSLRVLALNPRLMILPFFALVFTGFTWLFVVLSFLALGLPPASPSSGFLYQEMFLAYLITYFLSCYFMAAIVGASFVRLQGGHPTVMDGVEAANASFFQIPCTTDQRALRTSQYRIAPTAQPSVAAPPTIPQMNGASPNENRRRNTIPVPSTPFWCAPHRSFNRARLRRNAFSGPMPSTTMVGRTNKVAMAHPDPRIRETIRPPASDRMAVSRKSSPTVAAHMDQTSTSDK